MIIEANPSLVQFVAVLIISGRPLDIAIQVATNSEATFSGRLSTEAKRVALQRAVPIPAGSPGAAMGNKTMAGQAISRVAKTISIPKR